MTNQPKLIVWDFDGVLNANIRDGRVFWADTMTADLGVSADAFKAHFFKSGLFKRIVRGELDLRDALQQWLEGVDTDVTADAFLHYWLSHDAHPDEEVLGWIHAHPARHVIGTNNEPHRAAYISDDMGFGDVVEHVFASGRMGVAKPDAAFFRQIEDWAKLAPADILLVDDTLSNIEACQTFGWRGFHFTPQTRAALPAHLGLKAAV